MPTYPTYQTDQTNQPTIDQILAARRVAAARGGTRYADQFNLYPPSPVSGAGGGGGNRNPHENADQPGGGGGYGAGQDPVTGAALGAGIPGRGGTKQQIRRATYGQLLELLLRHGATDPTILNREIQGIQRGTEANTQSIEESLGAQGYSSGVGQALVGASRAAGTEAVAGARAREAAAQEQRQRQNLLLTLELLINPKLQRRGQDIQKYIATHRQRQGTDYGGLLGGLGNLLKGLNTGKSTNDYGTTKEYGDAAYYDEGTNSYRDSSGNQVGPSGSPY